MTYSIFLDDERFPPDYSGFFDNTNPIIVRSYSEFMRLINEYGPPEKVSLDHDLGEDMDGMDCLKSLIAFCASRGLPFPEFQVHSMNPIGSKEMQDYINWVDEREPEIREMYESMHGEIVYNHRP